MCRFLFHRWRPEMYFYGIIMLMRNVAIALIPMAIPYEWPRMQINFLTIVLVFGLSIQLVTWPWRVAQMNFFDASISITLILGLNVVATSFGVSGGLTLGHSRLFFGVVLIMLGVLFCYIVAQHWHARAGKEPQYRIFLSHHKGGGGNTARLMKALL